MTAIFGTGESPHPKSHRVQVWMCGDPSCGHPHLILFDAQDNVIAEAVMPDATIVRMHDLICQREAK